MSWRGFFLRAGIQSDGSNIALERGNLTVQNEIIAAGIVPDQIVTAGAATFTIAQLLTRFVRRDPTGAARADLLPTAALMVAGIEGVFVGATFDFTISNEGSVTEIITVTTAAGLTLSGTMTIDGGDQRRFRAEFTNVTSGAEAVTIRSLGGSVEAILATTLEINTALDGILATAAEINARCDVLMTELVTTKAVDADESGTRFILNHATAFVSTLPAPAAGLEYWFYAGATQVTGGNHTIYANGGSNIIHGKLCSAEDAAGSVACHDDADTISFVADLMIEGDYVHLWSDGTSWFIDGMCDVQDGMSTTQAG